MELLPADSAKTDSVHPRLHLTNPHYPLHGIHGVSGPKKTSNNDILLNIRVRDRVRATVGFHNLH